jgi:small subunit ribosomal protein S3
LGQKINPIALRVAVTKDWRSRWFSRKKEYGANVIEDLKIRDHVRRRLDNAAISDVRIERYANRVRVNVHTARPGIVIGRKGQDIEKIRAELAKMTGKEIYVEIHEVKDPDANAQLVAEGVALQLERRIAFRRAMKKAVEMAMTLGAEGIRIQCSGRLGGAEIARREWQRKGRVPLHTLRENIDYGFAEALTVYGKIGVKCWIYRGMYGEEVLETDVRPGGGPRRGRR